MTLKLFNVSEPHFLLLYNVKTTVYVELNVAVCLSLFGKVYIGIYYMPVIILIYEQSKGRDLSLVSSGSPEPSIEKLSSSWSVH